MASIAVTRFLRVGALFKTVQILLAQPVQDSKDEVPTRKLAALKHAGLCRDTVDGWLDITFHSCDKYWGNAVRCLDAASFAVGGLDASQVCCGCGGGTCTDEVGWLDAAGRDCERYRSEGWCLDEGYGPNWNLEAWGSFCGNATSAAGGFLAASEACCGCGRGRLYGSSMDVIFQEPRCFSENISLSEQGVISSFRGCRVEEPDAGNYYGSYYSGNDDDDSDQVECPYYYAFYYCGRPWQPSDHGWCYCPDGEDTGDAATSKSTSTSSSLSTGTSTSTTSSMGPETFFLDWLDNYAPSVSSLDLSRSSSALCQGAPTVLQRFPNLRSLNLSHCDLRGSFPASLGLLPLEELDLSHNTFGLLERRDSDGRRFFEATGSAFPASWATLTSLKTLDLSGNSPGICAGMASSSSHCPQDDDGWKAALPSMEYTAQESMTVLRLSGFMGSMPSQWRHLQNLKTLDLAGPQFQEGTTRENAIRLALPTWLKDMALETLQLAFLDISAGESFRSSGLASFCPVTSSSFQHLRRLELRTVRDAGFTAPFLCLANLGLEELVLNDYGPPYWWSNMYLPEEYANFTSLKRLSLRGSAFEGDWPAWLGDLPRLEELDLAKTAEHYSDPDFSEPQETAQDYYDYYSYYYDRNPRFEGEIPEKWHNLRSTLKILRIDLNVVNNGLPPWLKDFEHLTALTAHQCFLSGELPALPLTLQELDLSGNDLNGTFSMANYSDLRSLRLGHNTRLHVGSLPDSIGTFSNLEVLDLAGTRMSGTLPADLFKLVGMKELSLQSCSVSGTLPAEVGNLRQLRVLDLSGTSLEGSPPRELGTLVDLRVLNLSHITGFSGSGRAPLPLDAFASLTALNACLMSQASWLGGSIPASLGGWSQLTMLTITASSLEGWLPDELAGMHGLMHLELADNNLRGPLPGVLASLQSLAALIVRNNGFTGTLPPELGNIMSPDFTVLDLRGNLFSDTLSGRFLSGQGAQGMQAHLRELLLADNPGLGGSLDLVEYVSLKKLDAARCNFESVAGIAREMEHIDLSFNSLTAVPQFVNNNNFGGLWTASTSPLVQSLLLRGNGIHPWPIKGTYAVGTFQGDFAPTSRQHVSTVAEGERLPCFIALTELDVSHNPLGVDVQSFIHSLAPQMQTPCGKELSRLVARNTSLSGTLYTLRQLDTTNPTSHGLSDQMLPLLMDMDLSANNISRVTAQPEFSDRLVKVRLDLNALVHLDRQWLGEQVHPVTGVQISQVRSLNISGNPMLRFSVLPPRRDCGHYIAGEPLAGDPVAYSSSSSPGVECTSPCAAFGMVLLTDSGLPDVGSLCRCEPGYGLPPDGDCFDEYWHHPNSSMSCQDIVARQLCAESPGAEQCCACGGEGIGGNGPYCHRCPQDTYALSDEADSFKLRSECRACPAHSSTENRTGVDTLCGCKCEQGMFLFDGGVCAQGGSDNALHPTGSCQPCPYLRTTAGVGAMSDADCRCDLDGVHALIDVDGECGCDQNYFLNRVARACEPCADDGENCAWVRPFTIKNSTQPPDLVPGFWAPTGHLAGASDPAELESFGGHSIYKCFDASTCVDRHGNCAEGREGTACSLCKPGYTGSSTGACRKCEGSSAAWLVLAAVATPFIVLLAHLLAGESATHRIVKRRVLLHLRSFRVSIRQLVKHVQVVSVVGGYSIKWPTDVKRVFETLGFLNFDLVNVAGLGCLGTQQTASLELELGYAFPCAFVLLGILLTPPLAVAVSFLLRAAPIDRLRRFGAHLSVSLTAATRAVFWIVVLFFPTFLGNGLRLFTCNLHPNKELTVATLPHLHCLGSKSGPDNEWLILLPFGIAYTGILLLACIGGYILVYKRTWRKMEASDFETRGKYEFLFEDFRNSSLHWPLLLLCRDAYVNAVGTILNNYGASQMILVATGMLVLGFLCILQDPYVEAANTLVEVLNAIFVFTICMFTAGMGFTQAPGLNDMATLAKDDSSDSGESIMTTRARILLVLQIASMVGPFAVIAFKLLIIVPAVERNLPRWLLPLKEKDAAALRMYLCQVLDIRSGDKVNARNVEMMLSRLDTHELQQLVKVLVASPAASKDILRHSGSSTSVQKLVQLAISAQADQRLGKSEGGSDPPAVSERDCHTPKDGGTDDHGELVQLLQRERDDLLQEKEEQAAEIKRLVQLLRHHSITTDEVPTSFDVVVDGSAPGHGEASVLHDDQEEEESSQV